MNDYIFGGMVRRLVVQSPGPASYELELEQSTEPFESMYVNGDMQVSL